MGTKVEKVLRYPDRGDSVEEARRKMLAAGEAPAGVASERKKNEAAGFTAEAAAPAPVLTPAAPRPAPAAPEPPPPAVPASSTDGVERLENAKFVLAIFQENGEWVGEITYKNGAGVERFAAPTRKALDMRLLEGKANATLRVRQAIRREKFGEQELDKFYPLPDGLTTAEFNAMPEVAQGALIDGVATKEAVVFRDTHPEFYAITENSQKIQQFLFKQNLPITVRNLEYAFKELMEGEEEPLLVVRPQPTLPVTPSVPPVAPVAVDSAPVAAVEPTAPAVAPAAPPAPPVRKRGTTGLQPGFSSAGNTELDAEEGNKSREPAEAELRNLPLEELRRRARATYKPRQF